MAHRKVIYLTVKVVVDIDNDEFDEDKTSEDYTIQVDSAIDDFVQETDLKFDNTSSVNVHSSEIQSWDFTK